ncbi:MAG: outer membrane lipoprotein carrier protein LolA [Bryobacteraceae bacterium]|nr:outer membrane lipoprotein carrier protein LolA [Bryobacteraceae bacterium]
MLYLRSLVAVGLAFAATPLVAVENIESVLGRMDQSAKSFRSLSADLKRISHTAVLNESTTETGTILMSRPKPKDMRMRVEIEQPDKRSVSYASRTMQVFYPKINTVQEYDLGRQGGLVDQALLLGFGTNSGDLLGAYGIKVLGEEALGGQTTTRVELTPKAKEAKEHITKVELWVGEAGHPLQQKIWLPSRDYYLVTYTGIKVNPPISEEDLKLRLPKGVKKEYPQR